MMRKFFLPLLLCSTFLMQFYFCSKKEQHDTGQINQQAKVTSSLSVQTIKAKPINYDSLLVVISDLVKAVQEKPTDIDARRQLANAAYDSSWDTILAAGYGSPIQKGATSTISLRLAEQAAKADAFRWAVYIKNWLQDPTTPDIGKLSADVQGGNFILKKLLPDSAVVVLLEVKKSNIP